MHSLYVLKTMIANRNSVDSMELLYAYCTFRTDFYDICNTDNDCEDRYECMVIANHTRCKADRDYTVLLDINVEY